MSEKKPDFKGQAGVTSVANQVNEFAFAGTSGRYSIASLSPDSGAEEGLFSSVFSFAKSGVRNAFKFSKREWITLAVIVLIWAGTGILRSYSIHHPIVRALAFLTASYNGLDSGVVSIVGGIAAKSFVLAAVSETLIPLATRLFTGKGQTAYAGFSRFAQTFKKINLKNRSVAAIFLLGMGVAFLLYGFLSVDGSFQNNFVAILAALSIMKNFGNKSSFLFKLLSGLRSKTLLGEKGAFLTMSGMVSGYILSLPVSFMSSGMNGIGYIIGGAAAMAGVALLMSGRSAGKVEQSI